MYVVLNKCIHLYKKILDFFLQTHIKYIIPYNYPNIDLNIKSEYFPYIATVYTPTCKSSAVLGESVVCL